jgi:hypothetical protein
MKKLFISILAVALSFGVFAQTQDTMFVHTKTDIIELATANVDSIVFYRTGPSAIRVTGVTLDKTDITIAIGDDETLAATISPTGAKNSNINWTSIDPAIATVDEEGKVVGVAAGTTLVIVSTLDGAKVAVCEVTVINPTQDYSGLRLNEVNGVNKWIELYNAGTVDINLEGVTMHYSNSATISWNTTNTWTGTATDVIPAGGYFTTPTDNAGESLGTGLSANNANVRLQLRDPDGNVLDMYENLANTNTNGTYPELVNRSHVRIPDGTGPWYYTADGTGTPNATNGTTTAGLIKLGEEDGQPLYTKIKLNEVSGAGDDNQKFYEFINLSTTSISLEGFVLYYNANSNNGQPLPTGDGNLTWTGNATHIIRAGELLCLIGRNNPGSFTTGLTSQRNLIITLKNAVGGTVVDQCIRALDTGEYEITEQSFSRIPDGTGPFYFTTPTLNVKNGTDTTGLILVPQTQ